MRLAVLERLLDCTPHALGLELSGGREQSKVGQVLHARVHAWPGDRIGVELLGDVRFDWVDTQLRWRNACELEHVIGDDDVGLYEHWIAERDIDTEGKAERLSRKTADSAKAESLVLHAIVRDFRVVSVWNDLEGEEVVKVEAGCGLTG